MRFSMSNPSLVNSVFLQYKSPHKIMLKIMLKIKVF
jgi:hypothetical protein